MNALTSSSKNVLRESVKLKVNKADFKISDVLHVTRLVYVVLLAYSMFCNFRLGHDLSAVGYMAIIQGLAYMMLDIAAVAYLKLAKDGQPVAWIGFVMCVFASFIAGWSYQCNLDAMAKSGLTGPAVEALSDLAEYSERKSSEVPLDQPINKLVSDRKALKHRESYTAAVVVASDRLGYPSAHALFYESSLFKDDPEGWMSITRAYFMILLLGSSVCIPILSWSANNTLQVALFEPDPEPTINQPDDTEPQQDQVEPSKLALVG